jgi:hypothetical protein
MQRIVHSSRRSISATVSLGILLFAGLNSLVFAQELAVNSVPDAPVPVLHGAHAILKSGNAPQMPVSRRWFNLKDFSIAFLAAGETLDMWSTHRNLTHPRWICGYSAAFGNAVTYISNDDKQYDPYTIQNNLCGPGPSGQLANYAYDVTRTGAYTEDGWVTGSIWLETETSRACWRGISLTMPAR